MQKIGKNAEQSIKDEKERVVEKYVIALLKNEEKAVKALKVQKEVLEKVMAMTIDEAYDDAKIHGFDRFDLK